MTESKKITVVTNMCDETDSNLITQYLENAAEIILNKRFPFGYDMGEATVPSDLHYLQCEMAAYMINKRGAEGETVHLENTIHRHYSDADIPTTMLRRITPLAGVI